MSIDVGRRLFSVDEYHRMLEAGVLGEDDRVELIEGEIIEMAPIGRRHAACVDKLTELLKEKLGRAAIVRVQGPVRLNDQSEPEPDVALLRRREDFYAREMPGPADVLLIVEVADTSSRYDRAVKVPLYARAGIPELWLIDLETEEIEVHFQPSGDGYQRVCRLGRGESVAPQAFPQVSFTVSDLFPMK